MSTQKVIIDTQKIEATQRFTRENVVTATISNYSGKLISFTHKGIKRTIPPVNLELDIPQATYKFENCGYPFDLDITIEIDANSGYAILDYSILPAQNC